MAQGPGTVASEENVASLKEKAMTREAMLPKPYFFNVQALDVLATDTADQAACAGARTHSKRPHLSAVFVVKEHVLLALRPRPCRQQRSEIMTHVLLRCQVPRKTVPSGMHSALGVCRPRLGVWGDLPAAFRVSRSRLPALRCVRPGPKTITRRFCTCQAGRTAC